MMKVPYHVLKEGHGNFLPVFHIWISCGNLGILLFLLAPLHQDGRDVIKFDGHLEGTPWNVLHDMALLVNCIFCSNTNLI